MCGRQLKVFVKSLNGATNFLPLHVAFFGFSVTKTKQCLELSACLKSHWYFKKISKQEHIRWNTIHSNIL